MVWNYRVCKHGKNWFEIHEVYYKDKKLRFMEFITTEGEISRESIEELKSDLKAMLRSLEEPILDYKKICSKFESKNKVKVKNVTIK